MRGWFGEPMRHGLAARGIKSDAPYMLKERGIRDLNIEELDRKLNVYISYVDGNHEIENGREASKGYYNYINDMVGLDEKGIYEEDLVNFFENGNRLFDVVAYEVIGSRAHGTNRPDSDTDILLYLKFTDEAIELLKPTKWDWDPFFDKLRDNMVNENFTVKTKRGKDRWIDVFFSITYPGDIE